MTRLVQFLDEAGKRCIGIVGPQVGLLEVVRGYDRVYDLAMAAIRSHVSLEQIARSNVSLRTVDYESIARERRLCPPIDHVDSARVMVSLTGLTHLGSAESRNRMHTAASGVTTTDTAKMFQIGIQGGKPRVGEIGAQPEWAYKGDGRCIVAPEQPLTSPVYAEDGGEEAEIAGLYVIDDAGNPWRVGYAVGNEFADHVLEKQNYLYLAHSKLRECSVGPELLTGPLPNAVEGEVRVIRDGDSIWKSPFLSGEDHMSHSIANLEHHHFKYELFRRPGDVHVHFFGANGVSFGNAVHTQDGDIFEIDVPIFGRPLRNTLRIADNSELMRVRAL